MNRLTFILLSGVLCLIPFFFFGGLRASGNGSSDGYSSGRYYNRGPSFLFMSFGNSYSRRGSYGRGRSSTRGRGFSSGGFRSGGSRSGK